MAHKSELQWQAPALERRDFRSWDEFFAYLEEYQQRTRQVFSRRSATSVKTRNQVLASIAASGRPLPSPLLPDSYLDYTRMLQCSHKNRGEASRRWNGEQPSECQARVNATLQLGEDGNYYIRVTKANLVHNHPIGGNATVISAPSAATSSTSSTTSGSAESVPVQAQTQAQAVKRRRVGHPRKHPGPDETEFPSDHAARNATTEVQHVPTMTDVRDFLGRVKRMRSTQHALQSVEERLAAYVNEFAALDGNVAKIFVDDEKVLSSITLQTKHMRKVFEAFPEVLRVDAIPSSKGNAPDSSYRVFSLMAHDTLGNWQYVQHSIVESDRSETLRAALDQFKTYNARHPRVRALIVPSDASPELEELRLNFPAARMLYSQFHVVRALHKAIAEHGDDLTSWHRDRLTGIAQLLVYAPTSLVYGANIAVMADVLGSKQHSFFRYFLEKWDSCRDRWSTFAREGVTTFSISEKDGQFAPTWKAIFAAANEDMALDETVAAIRYYQTVVERAFTRHLNVEVENSTTAARNGSGSDEYDAEMRLLVATVSPAASSLIFPQYRYAITRGAYQFFEPSRGSFFVSAVTANDVFCDEPTKEFCVEADRGWQCSCAFMTNHRLPCRHVFYVRRIVRCSTVIPMEHLDPRWVLAKAKHFFDTAQVGESTEELAGEAERAPTHCNVIPPPGAWQKYVTAQEVGKRISQRMMEMDPEEFDRALRFYKLVENTLNVRPFDLNSAAIARLKGQPGGFSATAEHKPNWVEPDPTRTLAPRVGPPAVVGTVYVPANDPVAATVAARKMQLAQLANANRSQPNRPQTTEIIDLQDESEEEEKTDSSQQNKRGHAREAASTQNNGPGQLRRNSSTGREGSTGENQPDKTTEGDSKRVAEDHNDVSADELAIHPDQPQPWEDMDEHGTSPPYSPAFSS